MTMVMVAGAERLRHLTVTTPPFSFVTPIFLLLFRLGSLGRVWW